VIKDEIRFLSSNDIPYRLRLLDQAI